MKKKTTQFTYSLIIASLIPRKRLFSQDEQKTVAANDLLEDEMLPNISTSNIPDFTYEEIDKAE